MNPIEVYSQVMSKVEEYRKLAEEAERLAEGATEQTAKDMYRKLAESWRSLSSRAERDGERRA